MISKILGALDLLVAVIFFINNTFDKNDLWFSNKIVLILGLYLLIKGLIFVFTADFASVIDIIVAVIIILSVWITIPSIIAIVVLIFLFQKGILSLLS